MSMSSITVITSRQSHKLHTRWGQPYCSSNAIWQQFTADDKWPVAFLKSHRFHSNYRQIRRCMNSLVIYEEYSQCNN